MSRKAECGGGTSGPAHPVVQPSGPDLAWWWWGYGRRM